MEVDPTSSDSETDEIVRKYRVAERRRRRDSILANRRLRTQIRSTQRRIDTARQCRRSRTGAIVARRATDQIRSRRQLRNIQNDSMEVHQTTSDSHLYSSDSKTDSETDIVVQLLNRMRNRHATRPLDNGVVSDEENMDDSDGARLGVQDFNSPDVEYPLNQYQLKYAYLGDDNNYTCQHCHFMLWKEERIARYNCCNKGISAIHALEPIPDNLRSVFQSASVRNGQRRYNGLFSFSALGAGGMEKRAWTQPQNI